MQYQQWGRVTEQYVEAYYLKNHKSASLTGMLAVVIEEFLPEKYDKLVSFNCSILKVFFQVSISSEFVKPWISFIFDKFVVTGEFDCPS